MKFLPSHAASPGSTIYATTYLTFSGELERPEHVEVCRMDTTYVDIELPSRVHGLGMVYRRVHARS